MRRHLRVLAAVALAGVAVSGLGACGLTDRSTYEDDAKLSANIKSVRLDSGSGGLTLRGKKSLDTVSVHRELRYRGERPEKASHHVENGVLVLGGCGSNCSVHYTVVVPAGLPVTGETGSGAVNLSEVGAVRMTTSSGAVNLNGVSGAVDVRTSNGRIHGRGLRGNGVQARTSNGAVDLVTEIPQSVLAETSNGAISLTVPGGRHNRYRIAAETDNGHKSLNVPNDPAGTYRLDLTTANGAITVKEA
ncbi:lipoprotein [Streptomyces paromomycinus]|uniref:Lipoprotein n=1 Tax=Streptomyces paromomycinus TaxID=92743 RepID=A0A401WCP4_STREY|nr:lipoprotein [Streptomyces paromomycinus]